MAAFQKALQSHRLEMTQTRLNQRQEGGWERHRLPEVYGECYSERLPLDDGLVVVRSRYHPTRNLVEETVNPHDRRMLVITYGIQGRSVYAGTDGYSLDFRAGYTTITAFRCSHGERCYEAGATVSQLRLLVGEGVLCRYLGAERAAALLATDCIRQLAFHKTSRASSAHAGALAQHLLQNGSGTLDAHIHALTLLSEQLSAIAPSARNSPQLGLADIEKLERARDLMLEQMDQALTIPYLSATVGLNEFKFKQGFRQHFKTTPHQMLNELRMRKAYALLETGCQVAQAAYRVGYRHPNNFSAAFSSFFGKSPKSVFGKRR
ncbi:helix-turn-helix domain-containing protein [Pseudomonas sp. MBLB4123]|uniref:helix-turn-helix domain-containing protein n=1 Tax=Pseudomonas sp. MBLB4123 TaxID=3451557 RepID=UPI003F74C567